MEDNAVEDDQIDFSIISPQNHKPKQIDFSVHELLVQAQNKSNTQEHKNQQPPPQQQVQPQGSFMKDLQKMQKQISYQTIPYDIYQPTQQLAQYTYYGNLQTKQQDTYTKTTNNVTNLTKLCQKNIEIDFKHLIIDFNLTQDKLNKLKIKQSIDDYLQDEILTTKMVHQKHNQKQSSLKSIKSSELLYKNGNFKNKLVSTLSKQYNKQRSKNKLNQNIRKKSINQQISKRSSSKSLYQNIGNNTNNKKSVLKDTISSKSKSKSKKKINEKTNTKIKIEKQKYTTRFQSEVYSEYYGFQGQINADNRKNSKKSLSKNKKIVFMNKNVNLHN